MKLAKGLFWMAESDIITHKVTCDSNGKPIDEEYIFTAKNGRAENHKAVWNTFPHSVTGGRPYNYYPRGRVEIRRAVATVYLNPVLCTEEFKQRIRSEFCLCPECGIKSVVFKADESRHYRFLKS